MAEESSRALKVRVHGPQDRYPRFRSLTEFSRLSDDLRIGLACGDDRRKLVQRMLGFRMTQTKAAADTG